MGKILLVDDAEIMLHKLTDILEANGHQIIATGRNGQEGFELYKKYQPDLVIMDITMPEVNGIEAIKLIKDFDSNAYILICSCMDQKELIMQALYFGALDFIVKPFKDEKLIETVNNILNSH